MTQEQRDALVRRAIEQDRLVAMYERLQGVPNALRERMAATSQQLASSTIRRARWGNQIITQAREADLVSDRLRIIDATHLQAKIDLFRLPEASADTPAAQATGTEMKSSSSPCAHS